MNNEVEAYVGELRDLRAIAAKYWQDQMTISVTHQALQDANEQLADVTGGEMGNG